jgi:hypothetical protein
MASPSVVRAVAASASSSRERANAVQAISSTARRVVPGHRRRVGQDALCRQVTARRLDDVLAVRRRAAPALAEGGEGERHLARAAIDDDRLLPRRTVGAHFEMEIVVAGEAKLGPPREAGLIEQARRVACFSLVDLELLPVAVVVEQRCVRRDREPVGAVGRRIDTERFEVAVSATPAAFTRHQRAPCGARPHDGDVLVRHPGDPTLARHVEHPRAVLVGRDLAGVAAPRAARTGGDDVAAALGRRGRRRAEIAVEHAELNHGVEGADRPVMGDVLLGLGRHDVRQAEVGR